MSHYWLWCSRERARNAIVRYNWVHGVRTNKDGGIGIRGDDVTRGLIVHHNVIWDCGKCGILVKGDDNAIFNNTLFGISNGSPTRLRGQSKVGWIIPADPEPVKPWKPYHEGHVYLDHQNANSLMVNNLVDDIWFREIPLATPNRFGNNIVVEGPVASHLSDVADHVFTLRDGSAAIDAGVVVEDYDIPFNGQAPDCGAYEDGMEPWVPGADWEWPIDLNKMSSRTITMKVIAGFIWEAIVAGSTNTGTLVGDQQEFELDAQDNARLALSPGTNN